MPSSDRVCESGFILEDEPGTLVGVWIHNSLYFRQDKFVGVGWHFYSKDYGKLSATLIEKYGAPTSRTAKMVTNWFGGQFHDEILTWKRNKHTVQLTRYGQSVEFGAGLICSNAWVEEMQKAEAEAKKKRANAF